MIFSNNKLSQKHHDIITKLQERLKLATHCLDKISSGNFDFTLDTVSSSHHTDEEGQKFITMLNRMSIKLNEYSAKEQERLWIAEGMSKFMDLMRGDASSTHTFYDKILSLLVQYAGANQGGIFIYNDKDPQDLYLELSACYAYGKKKFAEKRITIGEGMLGECFTEKVTSQFTNIPNDYINISSGLGAANPGYLLLVPLVCNNEALGVLELAAFQNMESYKVEFIERIAENIASVILNSRNANRVDQLFEESKTKAIMLQEKEEVLKKNVEELVDTQNEMKRNQIELDQQTTLLKFILNNLPFPVFVKDEKGRYALVNKAEAKLFNLTVEELIGKDDSHFVSNDDEWKVIQESDAKVMSSNSPVELPLQYFTTTQGYTYVFKTTKIPFINNVTGNKNILGVSLDLTEKLDLEKKLLHEKTMSNNNALINITGRQRMLSQKIGFYSEALVRGKKKNIGLLHDAVELYEHSLQIIRYGGMPLGISCESPLPASDPELLPYLDVIEEVWATYKKAAEAILYYYKTENDLLNYEVEIENSINLIEDTGELLLTLNDNLMIAYFSLNQLILNKA